MKLVDGGRFNDFRKKKNVETKWESAHFNGGVFWIYNYLALH